MLIWSVVELVFVFGVIFEVAYSKQAIVCQRDGGMSCEHGRITVTYVAEIDFGSTFLIAAFLAFRGREAADGSADVEDGSSDLPVHKDMRSEHDVFIDKVDTYPDQLEGATGSFCNALRSMAATQHS